MDGIFSYIISVEFVNAVLRMSTPLLFVAMAAVIGARANVLCIAFEGVMLCAALGGVLASGFSGSLFVGMLVGLASGLIITALFAYFVLVLRTEPILVGLALNLFASGITVTLLFIFTGSKTTSVGLPSLAFPNVNIPGIENIPILGDIISGQNILTYFAIVCVFLVHFMLFKTQFGLRVRSVGEAPHAAEVVGINVVKTQFAALMISGVLAAFGGMFMSMGYLSAFTREMISGRGFIGIAAQSLGSSSPILTMIWTFVFGGASAIGNAAQGFGMRSQIATMFPYVITILGLMLAGIKDKYKKVTLKLR